LVQRVWCPPTAGAEALYRQDAFLAATFASGGSNNEIFAVAGNGQLLRWKGNELSPVRSLFEKPAPNDQQVVQPGFASFSPDGQWLLTIRPTLASAANAETVAQGAPPPRAPPAGARSGYEPCEVQTWRWTAQHQTYESAGADLEIPRLRGTRTTTFAWSSDSDRVVLTNWRSGSDVECHLLEAGENGVKELQDRSAQLNRMKIAAIAFSPDRSRIAAVSSERKVMLIGWEDLQVISKALNGQDWIQLPEGFQPNAVAFGPGDDELTLTSWTSIRILNTRNGKPKAILPPTFRDQFMRIVFGPGDSATRLVAISFYGRVQVAKNARWQESAEPVVFRASMGVPQFSPDGKRLLILSGGVWNVFDNMRLIDVTQLYRPQGAAPENFEGKPAPSWLTEIASAVSALDVGGDGSLTKLEAVQKKYPKSKAGDAYESVWKRFFPDERSK
jgi:WD40 repeat protein